MNKAMLDSQGRELQARLANFEADYEKNPNLTEAQKQSAPRGVGADLIIYSDAGLSEQVPGGYPPASREVVRDSHATPLWSLSRPGR